MIIECRLVRIREKWEKARQRKDDWGEKSKPLGESFCFVVAKFAETGKTEFSSTHPLNTNYTMSSVMLLKLNY